MRKSVDFQGCQLTYDLFGAGPPVVFIQGVGACGSAWRPQTEELQQQFTCLTFDNRGMGASQPAGTNPLTVDQMAADVLALLDSQDWPKAHLVGHSLGGLVALYSALAAPKRISSLALLNTFADGRAVAPLTASMFWWGMRSAVGTKTMRRYAFLRLIWPGPALAKCDWRALAESMAALLGHDLADRPPIVPCQMRAMRRADATGRLSELIGIRTLVLSGLHDMLATPALGRSIAHAIPGAIYHELRDASHAAPIQFPAHVNQLLKEHLAHP
jgi:pimeloyl-ACP methyl ester carboxylesterase